jgi:hypothetical protein
MEIKSFKTFGSGIDSVQTLHIIQRQQQQQQEQPGVNVMQLFFFVTDTQVQ